MSNRFRRHLLGERENFERLEETRLSFLRYVNALMPTCADFGCEIATDEQKRIAMRISLDAWSDPCFISLFAAMRPGCFPRADYDLVQQWVDYLHGPMYCMETHGQTAIFMCEGTVFEVVSFGRSWDDMVPVKPDLVLATLLPYDDIIVADGLIAHHTSPAEGTGVQRVQREYEAGKERGIVKDASSFSRRAREINALRHCEGLDPTSYWVYRDYVLQISMMTSGTCLPFVEDVHMRCWDDADAEMMVDEMHASSRCF